MRKFRMAHLIKALLHLTLLVWLSFPDLSINVPIHVSVIAGLAKPLPFTDFALVPQSPIAEPAEVAQPPAESC